MSAAQVRRKVHWVTDLKPGLEKYEMLYQHDAGVIRLRRYLAQQARKQLSELQAAGKL